MAEKNSKKELRAPDALQRAGLEAESWIADKAKFVVGAIVAVLLIFGGIALADWMGERKQREAQKALGAALAPLDRPVAAGDSPPPPTTDPNAKPFASQKEKDEALVASLSQFRTQFEGTRSATTAALPLAQANFRLGKYDEALQGYDAFLKDAPKNDPLRALALEGRGYTFEARKQLDEAVAAYDELAKHEAAQFLDGMGLFHKARIQILQGKNDEAAKTLAQIPVNHPNSAAARMATERMNVLAAQGVKIPDVAPAPAAGGGADAGVAKGS